MARTRNHKAYADTKARLLGIGVELLRVRGFAGVGVNEIRDAAGIPKGSFYHYFQSKERFGLEVAGHYHAQQMAAATAVLADEARPPRARLQAFFEGARDEYRSRGFSDGCLMCNLSTELGHSNAAFAAVLAEQWRELSAAIADCLATMDPASLGLGRLSASEAADWMLNAWSGALTRMKADRSVAPLDLFMKSMFEGAGS